MPLVTLTPVDPGYPARLRPLARPPPTLTIEGGPLEATRAVAIVGARGCSDEAARFAWQLAVAAARAGAVVISGGAVGIDAAAHRGALSVAGRTWAICATGRGHCFPKEHAPLFAEIARGPGAVVWPFPDATAPLPNRFLYRNGVLVALADAVVIVEAGHPSGTYSTASTARKQGRAVWAVPGPPWDARFAGCRRAIDDGAGVVTSIAGLVGSLGLGDGRAPEGLDVQVPLLGATSLPWQRTATRVAGRSSRAAPVTSRPPRASRALADLSPTERALYEACATAGRHIDEIAARARVCTRDASTGLLTLALENVLVEGPEGFYRRAD